ncbi:MAG: stalk domain-containing protein [Bacillota bacterium]|nr:stalk domain-containing protein [Bacillota bacterium]
MKIHKGTAAVLAVMMFMMLFVGVGQADAKVIENDGNPVQMVLTDWGGVSLNLQGQEKYFKVWERSTGACTKVDIALTNIDAYDVDGRNLAYTVSHGSYMDVYLYDLETKQSTLISKTFTTKRNVKISGDRIAWVDYGIGSGGICIYNLSSSSSTNLQLQESENIELVLSDSYLAYLGHKNGNNGVFVYNLKDGTTSVAASSYGNKASLSLSGEKIVWAEGSGAKLPVGSFYNQVWGYAVKNNALNEVWMFDISKGQLKQLTNNSTNDVQPCVWGNYVAWVQTSGGSPDVNLMNLDSGIIEKLASTDFYEVKPAMDYGYVSWLTVKGNAADLAVQALSGDTTEGENGNTENLPIKLMVNGTEYATNPVPYINNGRTMVPMRRVFEILGVDITWNDSLKCVTAVRGGTEVKIYIGSETAYKNGQAVTLDAPAEINAAAGRTMVPLRFVSESFGGRVDWIDATRTVVIDNRI